MKTKILFLTMVAGLFYGCNFDYEELKPKKANLTFEKLKVDDKTISPSQLLAQIQGKEKEGFIIKSIAISNSEIAKVEGTKPYLKIKILKTGTFTATIILEKDEFLDAKIENCEFDIKTFTFSKRTISDGRTTITKNEILEQIRGLSGLGYTFKNITILDLDKAEVLGNKPNFSIKIKQFGTFTAKIILEKHGFLDAKIENCEFDIKNPFTFSKLTRSNSRTTITKNELLKQVQGLSGLGYTIKNITISDLDKAEVLGNKPNFSITIKQFGIFKATIVLEKHGFLDATIENCEFEIKKPNLSFQKLTIANGKNVFSTQEILAQIRGLTNLDYQIKNITILDLDKAEVLGNKPNFSIKIKKAGNFTAKIILEKDGFLDVEIKNCEFDIFTFQKLIRSDGRIAITKNELLAQIQGSKTGYQIKNITISDLDKAEVLGNKPNFSITIKQFGIFKATIILEKSGFLDVTIENCEFEIKNKIFTFQKLIRSDGRIAITKNELLAQIQGSKTGYQIKNIAILDLDKAEVLGNKPNFSIKIKKAGNFTAKIILEKDGFLDVTIENCEFEIKKPNLSFQKLTIANGKNVFSTQEILEQIQGSKTGYQIKSIGISDNYKAYVEGTKPYLKINILEAGSFTATIVLEKSGFLDVTIENCEFDIKKPNLSFQKLIRIYNGNIITKYLILAQIQGQKDGYQIKSIAISDNDKAEVQGSKPKFSIKIKKPGNWTATIVLEKNGFLDATIENCEFDIKKPVLVDFWF